MCPFSHDVESTTRPAICKYFAKGGCKFGRKCALLHMTPDGTVVNRLPPNQQGGQFFPTAPQVPPPQGAFGQPPPGLLSMQAQGMEQRPNGEGQSEFDAYQYGLRNGYDMSQMDMNYASASPHYGSSPQNDRIAISPPRKGLSVLDAPLPNSFDSNGISWAARNGPLAASVPSKFDFDSPPSSLPRKSQFGYTALRDLHTSAFGDRGMDNVLAGMGSSLRSGTEEPLTFPKRTLYSERLRASRPMVSASLGTRLPTTSFEYSDEGEVGDDDTDREEDLLPASLHDLIPENRSRKDSRSRGDEETPASFLAAQRRTISTHGTPQDSKVGSPHSSSPSRFNGVFSRTQSAREGFNHVGSPLRDYSFPSASTSRPVNSGELSPGLSSPPRQASMSMLTQELQRTKLDAAWSQVAAMSAAPSAPPPPTRTFSNVSQRIEEEQHEELFDMDEEPKPNPNGGATSSGATWSSKLFPASSRETEHTFGAIGAHRVAK